VSVLHIDTKHAFYSINRGTSVLMNVVFSSMAVLLSFEARFICCASQAGLIRVSMCSSSIVARSISRSLWSLCSRSRDRSWSCSLRSNRLMENCKSVCSTLASVLLGLGGTGNLLLCRKDLRSVGEEWNWDRNWGAHASRVLRSASRRTEKRPEAPGETPGAATETVALPKLLPSLYCCLIG